MALNVGFRGRYAKSQNVAGDEPQVLELTLSRASLFWIVLDGTIRRGDRYDERLFTALDRKNETVAEMNNQILFTRKRDVRHLTPAQLAGEGLRLTIFGTHQNILRLRRSCGSFARRVRWIGFSAAASSGTEPSSGHSISMARPRRKTMKCSSFSESPRDTERFM